jgi:succinate dehydrogenase hydrophobic anchor subunit
MQSIQKRASAENFWIWFLKIISGLIIVVFLGLHLVVNHLVAPEGLLSYEDVLQYYSYPFIPVIEVLFLITVVSHSLIGIRSIILDLNPSQKLIRGINILFFSGGLIAIAYGMWLVYIIAGRT